MRSPLVAVLDAAERGGKLNLRTADIAQAFADNLKHVTGVSEVRIMRTNGLEAFRDNKTIEDVNRRRGEETFFPRDSETRIQVLDPDDATLPDDYFSVSVACRVVK